MPFDVTMPDGTVIHDVPDGTTRAQLQAKYQAHMSSGRQAGGAWYDRPAPQQESWWHKTARQFGDSIVNNVAGAAQGAASIPDALIEATAGGLRMLNTATGVPAEALMRATGNTRGAERSYRDRMEQDQALAHPVTIGGLIEKVAPTPQDGNGQWARFGSQMIGASMIPFGPKVTPPSSVPRLTPPPRAPRIIPNAQEVVAAGKANGTRVMTSDIRPPTSAPGKFSRWLGEKVPFVGTTGMREAQQAQRVAAIKNTVADFGGNAERTVLDDTAKPINEVAANLAQTRGKQLTDLTTAKNAVIDGLDGNVPVDRTLTSIDEQIAKMEALKLPELKPAIAKLQGWREALQSQPLRNVEDIRKAMGEAFQAPELGGIRSTGEKAVSAIYDPMKAEMGTFIAQRGGQDAFKTWANANEHLSAMAGELKSAKFRNVLRNEELTPESVGNLLFSSNPSDVTRLMSNLSRTGQAKAREAILQRAYDGAIGSDGLSAERFISNLDKLSPSITSAFKGADLQKVQGLGRLLDATRRAAKAGYMPTTGAQNTPLLVLGGLLQTLGTAGTAVAGGGYGLLARAYESAPVRDALIRAARVKAGTRSEAYVMDHAAKALAGAIGANIPKTAPEASLLARPMQMPLAADPETQGQYGQ